MDRRTDGADGQGDDGGHDQEVEDGGGFHGATVSCGCEQAWTWASVAPTRTTAMMTAATDAAMERIRSPRRVLYEAGSTKGAWR